MQRVEDNIVYAMAGVRLLSSLLECSGAVAMVWLGTAAKALQVNGLLALVGPGVLITVTVLGVAGLADKGIAWTRLIWILLGVGCVLYGARR